ncbi:MAG: NTP transferase domain-containing protein [Bacteroidota bacterium]
MKISGLILAAGLSGRMNSFKPILKIDNKTLVQLITEKLLGVCNEVIIVTGYNNNLVENSVEKSGHVKLVFNENYKKGMFTSLKKGLSEVSDADWVLYHFVDQPALSEKFYHEFVEQISDNFNWIQPAYNNVKGHPVLLSRTILEIIMNENDDCSLKVIGMNSKVKKKIWNCNYSQILNDVDTEVDFEKLISR